MNNNFENKLKQALITNGFPLRNCQEKLVCGALSSFFESLLSVPDGCVSFQASSKASLLNDIKGAYLFQWIQGTSAGDVVYNEGYAVILDVTNTDSDFSNIPSFIPCPQDDEESKFKNLSHPFFLSGIEIFSSILTDEIDLKNLAGKDFNSLYGHFKGMREARREPRAKAYKKESGALTDKRKIDEMSSVKSSFLNFLIKNGDEYIPVSFHNGYKDWVSGETAETLFKANVDYLKDVWSNIDSDSLVEEKRLELPELVHFEKRNITKALNKVINPQSYIREYHTKFFDSRYFWNNLSSIPEPKLKKEFNFFLQYAMLDGSGNLKEKKKFIENVWMNAKSLNLKKSATSTLLVGLMNSGNKVIVEDIAQDIANNLPQEAIKFEYRNYWRVDVNLSLLLLQCAYKDGEAVGCYDVNYLITSGKPDRSDKKSFGDYLEKFMKETIKVCIENAYLDAGCKQKPTFFKDNDFPVLDKDKNIGFSFFVDDIGKLDNNFGVENIAQSSLYISGMKNLINVTVGEVIALKSGSTLEGLFINSFLTNSLSKNKNIQDAIDLFSASLKKRAIDIAMNKSIDVVEPSGADFNQDDTDNSDLSCYKI